MNNVRGWKDGVYNPGFPPDKAYMERKAKEFAAAGFEWPEIKGVQFKRTKNQHKPMRNVVTRVVMVGFDPFNHSGLPEHIERKVVQDFWTMQENDFVTGWVHEALPGEMRFGAVVGGSLDYFRTWAVDPGVKTFGVALTEGCVRSDGNVDITNVFSVPIEDLTVVPPDSDVPMYGGVPMVQSGIDYTQHRYGKHRLFAPGSMDRLRHFDIPDPTKMVFKPTVEQRRLIEEADADFSLVFKDGESVHDVSMDAIRRKNLCPEVQTLKGEVIHPVSGAFAVGADGVKRDLRDIDFFSIALGLPEVPPAEKGVVVEVISDKPGDSADLWPPIDIVMSQQAIDKRMVRKATQFFPFNGHMYMQTVFLSPEDVTGLCELAIPDVGELPPMTPRHEGRIPHIQQFVDIVKQTSQPNRSPWGRVPVIDHTSEGFLTLVDDRGNPVSKEEQLEYEQAILKAQEEELTPEEIADREQAIQEASEGKLDYLLEGTQWDPKNRNK